MNEIKSYTCHLLKWLIKKIRKTKISDYFYIRNIINEIRNMWNACI